MTKDILRIGGAVGFWGETSVATPQLLAAGVDYLVYDYLAEITMSIMARARGADPERGYATDFVSAVIRPNLAEIARRRVKVISNAGGVNPDACAGAIRALVDEAGLDMKVGVVRGDDLTDRIADLAATDIREMFSGAPLPPAERIASVNAYLGALPIAAALDAGADIVVTGRVVDSAVTLAACLHEFGWSQHDYDAMAGAAVAGHILECSTQATGGNFTDWEQVADGIADIGYPIAEISAPNRKARAGWSASAPLPSRCSTRSATRRPTSCPTWSATSPVSPFRRPVRTGSASAGHAAARRPTPTR